MSENISIADLTQYEILPQVLDRVPEERARKYRLLPLYIEQGNLAVAMSDPGNLYAIEDLRVRTGLRIKPIEVPAEAIEAALPINYPNSHEIERHVERI